MTCFTEDTFFLPWCGRGNRQMESGVEAKKERERESLFSFNLICD
jgi:hypothetical protein